MNTKILFLLKSIALMYLSTSLLAGCKKEDDMPEKPNVLFYVLSDNNQLLQFNAKNATTAISTATITGLQSGEKLLSIDFRPATGQLYGLGSTSRLYVLNTSGAARAIGSAPFTPAIAGTSATIDFNPTVDRIRLISSSGQNLRLNPETGTVAATDAPINGVANAVITEVAYTNNTAGAAATVLFNLDATTDKLYKQDPPNDGKLVEAGSLNVDFTGTAGFDIAAGTNTALAALSVNNTTGLYAINLDNGSTTSYNNLPANLKVVGLAIPTQPVAYSIDADNNLLIFNPFSTTQQPVSKGVTGIQNGEKIVGIDMRPINGQLYGLGNTGRLYTFNVSSGAASVVGAIPLVLTGTDFGFDFNPTVDRIRIVSNTGLNLRANPNDGTLSAADLTLSPGTPAVTAVAYTNSFAGATSTTLFDIDTNTDRLYRQDPPNNGVLVDLGPIGINATTVNGFDIGGTSGIAFAIFTVGSSAGIYTINLQTGTATKTADFPKSVMAMAVGLGF
ncbi:DUF4394 domain-containing protein [Segetibacter sp.]|uniref:DUF4394 domain-containing protein n=1 Tax=Segetibacter sp. TaxID=2231182 RepID=UPI002616C141|nr:DUF4394 domain-containing protein [Segetibacter sp.]MCW3079573.1 hypothetical protein [Segetibacter sp.]